MFLKTMYITNDPKVAKIADDNTVDMIFVDLETIGKEERQPKMDTVKSNHHLADIDRVKSCLGEAKLLVRINPLHDNSPTEINEAIQRGADILMLPMFRTEEDVRIFLNLVNGKAKTMLLAETLESQTHLEKIVQIKGIDSIHIGLNDLHLAHQKKFMFELLVDGTVDEMCQTMADANIPYGFGGIARLGGGMLPAEHIMAQHYHLGSTQVILSRSFCDTSKVTDMDEIAFIFETEMAKIRACETKLVHEPEAFFIENQAQLRDKIKMLIANNGT